MKEYRGLSMAKQKDHHKIGKIHRKMRRGCISRIRAEKAGMGRLSIFPCVKKI